MQKQRRLYCGLLFLAIIFSSCHSMAIKNIPDSHTQAIVPTLPTQIARTKELPSSTNFSLVQKMYQIQSTNPMSKLRHGHQEFTINVVDAQQSLIIAFFGYTGPATYTLSNHSNGGDIRIAQGKEFWDLALIPTLACSLTISSDLPTQIVGLHRMHGNFSCPSLPAGYLNTYRQPVAITDGRFDIAIIVES